MTAPTIQPATGPPVEPKPAGRTEARIVMIVFVVFVVGGIAAILYSFLSDRTFERLDDAARRSVAGACDTAIDDFEALGALPETITREQLATRLDRENAIFASLIAGFDATTTDDAEGQAALRGWTDDWRSVLASREAYTRDVRDESIALPELSLPVADQGSIKPITRRMEEYAQLHQIAQCTPDALAAETVDGPRAYGIDEN
jgi:hypothetical protein